MLHTFVYGIFVVGKILDLYRQNQSNFRKSVIVTTSSRLTAFHIIHMMTSDSASGDLAVVVRTV